MQGQLRLTGGRRIQSPRGLDTRPTTARVREAMMNILAPRLPGSRWLDLCSGSGVMGCEALQRGAISVTALDRDPRAVRISERNLRETSRATDIDGSFAVVRSDLLRWLNKGWPNPSFDLVYFDPPYKAGLHQPGLDALTGDEWLHPESVVICEYASDDRFEATGGWIELDRRHYGSTGVVILSPPERSPHGGTDSMPPRTDP